MEVRLVKILLNSIFTGEYGVNNGNLPHEVINFFRSDNGKYYIYITPYGTINPHMHSEDLSCVLLIHSVGNHMVQVIAKAEPPFQLYTQGAVLNRSGKSFQKRNLFRQYENELVNDKITYAGLQPKEIFQLSKIDNEIHISLQIGRLCFPKKRLLLTNRENQSDGINIFYIPTTARLANQSMKTYFDDEAQEKTKAYKILRKIISLEDLWSKEWVPPKLRRDSIEEAIKTIKENIRFEKEQERFENSLDGFAGRIIKIIKEEEVG